jgi:hypothetical protein
MRNRTSRVRATVAATVVAVAAVSGTAAAGAVGSMASRTDEPTVAKTKFTIEELYVVTPDGNYVCWEDHEGQQSICEPAD